MKWFRLYVEARNDAKLRSLTGDQFRVWFNLLCFAAEQSDERGTIAGYDPELLAIEVAEGDVELLDATLKRLERLRIVTVSEDYTVHFLHFAERQYDKPSDRPNATAERKRRQRERERAQQEAQQKRDQARQTEGVTPMSRERHADVTPCHALDTDTETDLTSPNGDGADAPLPPPEPVPIRQRRRRPSDPIWDTFIRTFALDPDKLNRNERGQLNKACLLARESEATPDEIEAAVEWYRRKWPTIECTPLGVMNNWTRIQQQLRSPPKPADVYLGVDLHALFDDSED